MTTLLSIEGEVAMYKKYREIKVIEQSGYRYKPTPTIMLKGQWMAELGFDINRPVLVKCEGGKLTITPRDEICVEE